MTEIVYPFDPTGLASSNYIVDEQHIITRANYRDYYFIVPKFAPFFADGVVVKHHNLNEVRTLVEGVDYYLALNYLGATRSIGKPIYGAISLNSLVNIGIITISYHTLGGPWCADINYVLETLAERQYNPRIILWDQVTNVQQTFPPINHQQDFTTLAGYDQLINAIVNLSYNITNTSSEAPFVKHLVDYNNPHRVTLEQLGYTIATENEALSGSSTTALITSSTLGQVITNKIDTNINALQNNINISFQNINEHLNDFNNPHRVTKAQVGLSNVPNLELADDSEIINRDNVDKFVTLKQILNLLSNYDFSGSNIISSNYNIIPAVNVVEEGNGVLFHVATVDIPDDTVLYWSVANISTTDNDFYSTNGAITIQNNAASFVVITKADVMQEPNELFRIRLRKDGPMGPIVATSPIVMLVNKSIQNSFSVTASPTVLDLGESVTVTVRATNIPSGTLAYWSVLPVTIDPNVFVATQGSFSFTNNKGTFTVSIKPNVLVLNKKYFKVQIRLDSVSGIIIAETEIITVRRLFTLDRIINAINLFDPNLDVVPSTLFISNSFKPIFKTKNIYSRKAPKYTVPFDLLRTFKAQNLFDPRFFIDAANLFAFNSLNTQSKTRFTYNRELPKVVINNPTLDAMTKCSIYEPGVILNAGSLFTFYSLNAQSKTRFTYNRELPKKVIIKPSLLDAMTKCSIYEPGVILNANSLFTFNSLNAQIETRFIYNREIPKKIIIRHTLDAMTKCNIYEPDVVLDASSLFTFNSLYKNGKTRYLN